MERESQPTPFPPGVDYIEFVAYLCGRAEIVEPQTTGSGRWGNLRSSA